MFPSGTPFDLQMHLLRIPVRVIPTFWLVAALLGWNPDRLDLVFLWVMCVFGSVLFHELGHALTAEAFGYRPEIVLQHFGGYAAYLPGRDYSPWKSLLITIAGPFPQLILGLAIMVTAPWVLRWLRTQLNEQSWEYAYYTVIYLEFINVGWALMNLLPVLPLDGGRIVQALLEGAGFRDADAIALKISVGAGALTTAAAYHFCMQGVAIFFLMMTVFALQTLQARRCNTRTPDSARRRSLRVQVSIDLLQRSHLRAINSICLNPDRGRQVIAGSYHPTALTLVLVDVKGVVFGFWCDEILVCGNKWLGDSCGRGGGRACLSWHSARRGRKRLASRRVGDGIVPAERFGRPTRCVGSSGVEGGGSRFWAVACCQNCTTRLSAITEARSSWWNRSTLRTRLTSSGSTTFRFRRSVSTSPRRPDRSGKASAGSDRVVTSST